MVVLWTDALLYFLMFILVSGSYYLTTQVQFKRPLEKIISNKTGILSLVVLMFFILIGLLDSIHFKASNNDTQAIISLLDYVATPLRTQTEKTYSAPFATHLFSKENIQVSSQESIWGYPRLKYGGANLNNPETEKLGDISRKTGLGFIKGMLVFALLLACMYYLSQTVTAKNFHIWSLLGCLIVISAILIELSCSYHILGTDKVGEDVFYQAIKSIRTGLVIGALTTFIMLPLAIVFGILAGFYSGWIDDLIQYVYTTLNSIPSVLLIAASILMVQVYIANHQAEFTSLLVRADMRLLGLCFILGLTSWTGLCRLLRAETLKLKAMDYVQAAQALGVTNSKILYRHILPNVMHIIFIAVVLDFSALVLAEAVLSYINIGVDPTTYSWGNMINGARLEMAREPVVWWSLSAAFIFMFSFVLAANLFSDCVRDAFDPRRN